MTHKILLDVDTGVDDALAIMFALSHPDIEVRAITCVAGNTSVSNVLRNTLSVLDVAEAPPVPVAAGADRPLVEKRRDAAWLHGTEGLAGLVLPPSTRTPEPIHAVELMRRTLLEAEVPLTIVGLASLTNIALLLRMYPDVSERIDRILFMGGSAGVGNATAVAEFNVWHDPEAAHIVISSDVPTTMYGWDVAEQILPSGEQISTLKASPSAVAQTAAEILGHEVAPPGDESRRITTVIGDAGTLCALVAPELYAFEQWPAHVVLSDGPARGQTVVDRRTIGGEDTVYDMKVESSVIDVVRTARAADVIDLFLKTLS